jgi:hypothetical protein
MKKRNRLFSAILLVKEESENAQKRKRKRYKEERVVGIQKCLTRLVRSLHIYPNFGTEARNTCTTGCASRVFPLLSCQAKPKKHVPYVLCSKEKAEACMQMRIYD